MMSGDDLIADMHWRSVWCCRVAAKHQALSIVLVLKSYCYRNCIDQPMTSPPLLEIKVPEYGAGELVLTSKGITMSKSTLIAATSVVAMFLAVPSYSADQLSGQ